MPSISHIPVKCTINKSWRFWMSLKRPEKENFRKNVQQMRLLRKANSSSFVTLLRKLNFRGIALQSKLNSCVMVNVI